MHKRHYLKNQVDFFIHEDEFSIKTKSSKKDHPVLVQYAWLRGFETITVNDRSWQTWKRYLNIKDAVKAIKDHLRKHPNLFIFKLDGKIYTGDKSVCY